MSCRRCGELLGAVTKTEVRGFEYQEGECFACMRTTEVVPAGMFKITVARAQGGVGSGPFWTEDEIDDDYGRDVLDNDDGDGVVRDDFPVGDGYVPAPAEPDEERA